KMGDGATKAVPDVAALLKDNNDYVRRSALDCLGQIGPAAKKAVPSILPLLKDTNTATQSSALTALRGIMPEAKDVVEKLADFVTTNRTYSLSAAVILLGDYGKAASKAGPALLTVLKDTTRDAYTRASAGVALAKVDSAK